MARKTTMSEAFFIILDAVDDYLYSKTEENYSLDLFLISVADKIDAFKVWLDQYIPVFTVYERVLERKAQERYEEELGYDIPYDHIVKTIYEKCRQEGYDGLVIEPIGLCVEISGTKDDKHHMFMAVPIYIKDKLLMKIKEVAEKNKYKVAENTKVTLSVTE